MNPVLRVTTESGSIYEFAEGTSYVRRVGARAMRRDNEWVRVTRCYVARGVGMELHLEPLGEGEGEETIRLTTPVTMIEGVE